MLGLGDSRRDRRVELELAADRGVGHEGLGLLAGIAHLVDVLALAGAEGGVAQESDLRVNAEDLGAGNGLLADLDELVLVGLDELQRGTDRVGRGVGSAAEQAVGLAHLDEHGAEVVALLERGAALVDGHLAFAQLDHLVDHLVHAVVILGVDDLGTADVEADVLSGGGNLIGVADEHSLRECGGRYLR